MIQIEVADDPKQYKVTLLYDEEVKSDKQKILNMPIRKPVWQDRGDGIDIVSHYLVPREDLGELLRRFPGDKELSRMVQRDIRILDKYCIPLSEVGRHQEGNPFDPQPGDFFFKIRDHGGAQCRCHPDMKRAGQPTKDQLNYVLMDRRWRRTVCGLRGGEGKTIATLERARFLGTDRLLVVTTANMADDWNQEVKLVFEEEPLIYAGTPAQRKKLIAERPDAKIVVASYGLAPEIEMDGTFNQFILDESDLLQNPDAKRFQSFKPIIEATWFYPGIGVQAATGTVHGNRVDSTWFAYHLVHPYLAGTFKSFQERHMEIVSTRTEMVKKIDKNGYAVWIQTHKADEVITRHKSELRKKAAAAIFQSTEERSFTEIPKIVKCPMHPEQKKAFQAIREKTLVQIRDRELDMKSIKNRFIKLLQCCEGLRALDQGLDISSKLDWIRNTHMPRCERRKEKSIIFSSIRANLDLLAEEFADIAVPYNGSMTKVEKKLSRIAFAGLKPGEEEWFAKYSKQRDSRFAPGEAQHMLMILHDQTSRGQNLHYMCHTAVFMTPHPNCKANAQAAWRTQRHGQKSSFTKTYYLVTDSSFEQEFFDQVVEFEWEAQQLMDTTKKMDVPALVKALRRECFSGGRI